MKLEDAFNLGEWASVPLLLLNEGNLIESIGMGLLFGSFFARQMYKQKFVENDPTYTLKNPDISKYAGIIN
jgi:hypothetical protein